MLSSGRDFLSFPSTPGNDGGSTPRTNGGSTPRTDGGSAPGTDGGEIPGRYSGESGPDHRRYWHYHLHGKHRTLIVVLRDKRRTA